jgi:hypothetical protein
VPTSAAAAARQPGFIAGSSTWVARRLRSKWLITGWKSRKKSPLLWGLQSRRQGPGAAAHAQAQTTRRQTARRLFEAYSKCPPEAQPCLPNQPACTWPARANAAPHPALIHSGSPPSVRLSTHLTPPLSSSTPAGVVHGTTERGRRRSPVACAHCGCGCGCGTAAGHTAVVHHGCTPPSAALMQTNSRREVALELRLPAYPPRGLAGPRCSQPHPPRARRA